MLTVKTPLIVRLFKLLFKLHSYLPEDEIFGFRFRFAPLSDIFQCAIHFDEIDRLSSISHIGYTQRIGARIKGRLNLKSTLSG